MFDGSASSVKAAIVHRLWLHKDGKRWVVPYRPTWQYVSKTLRPFVNQFRKYVFAMAPEAPMGFGSRWYTGTKAEMYDKAGEKVVRTGVDRKSAYIDGFQKMEKIEVGPGTTINDGVEDRSFTVTAPDGVIRTIHNYFCKALKLIVARIILPRKPEYNVGVGVYLKQLEKLIYYIIDHVWSESVAPSVCKGMNALETAAAIEKKWNHFGGDGNACAVSLDAHRFDQHVSNAMLRWEHALYKMFFVGEERNELDRLLRLQINNKVSIECAPTIEQPGAMYSFIYEGRCSGDMNTALGNCLLMCAMTKTYLKMLNIEAEIVDNGDDCTVIMSKCNVSKFTSGLDSYYRSLGFLMKVSKPVYIMEHICFCQTHPVNLGDHWVMVRAPSCLSKDALVLKEVCNKTMFPRYCNEIGLGGAALCAGVPIMQEYYRALCRQAGDKPLNRKWTETGFKFLAARMPLQYLPVTEQTRWSFYQAFGIDAMYQRHLESYFSHLDLHYTGNDDGVDVARYYVPRD